MGKGLGWAHACLLGLCLFALLTPVRAQVATPEEEYKKLIRVDQDIQPLGEHPFGANISLYNGSLSFEQTDASLAGKGPLLQLVRTFKVQGFQSLDTSGQNGSFADWSLALPRLETMTIRNASAYIGGQTSFVQGWEVAVAYSDNLDKRCSHFSKPPTVTLQAGDPGLTPWTPDQWWKGYHMVIPGQGSQDLLANQDSQTQTAYPVVTKNRWRFSCLSSVANVSSTDTNGDMPNPVGEGFLGVAPDGTKYWFDELVYRSAPGMSRPLYDTGITKVDSRREAHETWFESQRARLGHLLAWLSGSADALASPIADGINRTEASLLVTKIEDRFGNTLVYSYNTQGYLTAITASDGRKLTVQYESGSPSQIQSVTVRSASGGALRTWHYTYSSDNAALVAVTLPNGHQWHYDLTGFDNMRIARGALSSCSTLGADTVSQTAVTGSITHPSGLKGTFTVKPVRHGQWWGSPTDPEYWSTGCLGEQDQDPDTSGSHVTIPYAWYSFTITQKVLSGAGLPLKDGRHEETWGFDYQESTQTWTNHTCTGSCKATTWTKVENPDGSTIQYIFSNQFDHSESHLLRTDYYAGAATGTPLRSVTNTYASPDTAPLPSSAGRLVQHNVNVPQITQYSPLQSRTIHQNGDTYTWQAEAFDKYTHVTKEKRFNAMVGQTPVEEATTYLNDTTKWVLGLPLTHTNLTTGEVVSENVYNTDDLLTSRKHFGQTVMSYTWNTGGQLASFTDANGHTTTLSNYKRGIPQAIGYPDGTSQSLAVDDLGQITSITNQAGSTTNYTYDNAGRLTQITYPSGWNPQTFAYDYVTSAERGLGANHWRRTVSQGNARHVTWYDALLRPVLTDTYIDGDSGSHISASTVYNWKGLTTFASWPVAGSPSLSTLTAGTTTTYDALGRVTTISQPSELGTLTTTTAYPSGARKQVTDPAGHVTTTSYQVFDTPSYKAVTQVTAPEGIVQTITRNLYGVPTALTQSGSDGQGGTVSLTKHLYYDARHRLCRTEEPETGSTLLGYDATGNLTWSAEGRTVSGSGCGSTPATSNRTNRSYDAMNRLTAVSYPDSQGNSTTTYNALGQVAGTEASATNGSAEWSYTYDTLGHLTGETLSVDGYSWPIHYTYDVNGALSQITYPESKSIAYAPDALGRPTQAGMYATGVSYFPDGALEHFTYISGMQYLAQRNPRHLLKNLTYAMDSTLDISQDYTYDSNANLATVNDLVGSEDKTLTYDALNRLTKVQASWGTATYGYDALNNLRKLSSDGVVRTYQYDTANRLTAIASGSTPLHTFAYDPQGNVTQKDSQSRVFSKAHRLLSVPGKASYVYDAAGRRVKTTDGEGHTTYTAYNRAGHLMYQWNTATDAKTDYVYLGKKLIAEAMTMPLPPSSAPSLSVPATDSDGNYTVSWDSVGTATSYILQEQTNGGSWSTVYSGSNLNQAIAGKGNGTYGYRIEACNPGGCSGWSATASVVVTHSPGSAPGLTVPISNHTGSYAVSWSAVGTATSYTLQEQTGSGSWNTVYSGGSLSKTISGQGNGSYGYRVQACNAGGCGNWSATGTITVLLPPAVPASPSGPTADNDGSYTVSWASVGTATSYTLQEQTNGGSWATAYSGTGLSKAESGKGNGSYGYRVHACNAGGCSGWSATTTVVVTHPPGSAPGLSVPSVDNNGSYTVSWGSVSTATSYTLQERKGSGSWVTAYSGGSRSKGLSGKADGTYGYRVKACTVGGCGPWSSTETVQVARPPASAPSLSVPSSNHSGSYTVSWGSVSLATSYTLQERKGSGSWSTIYTGSGRSKARSGRTDGSYGYRVRACSAGGCSAWSGTHTVSVAVIPSAPTGVYIYDHGNYKFIQQDLVWNPVSTATHYDVKVGSSSTVIHVGTATSYQLGGYFLPPPMPLPTVTGYVRACNANGCSAWVKGSGT